MPKAASSRGLFRATGKKSKPVAVHLGGNEYGKADALEREPDEFYPTPPEPPRAFIHAEIERLRQFPLIWGPACGTGVIGKELRAVGLNTFDSDLIDRGCGAEIKNFYDYREAPAPAVVENPPFAECGWGNGKARWLKHALDTLGVEYMALLMNWGWPGAGGLDRSTLSIRPPASISCAGRSTSPGKVRRRCSTHGSFGIKNGRAKPFFGCSTARILGRGKCSDVDRDGR